MSLAHFNAGGTLFIIQTLLRYRDNPKFRKSLLSRKAFICEQHFVPGEIIKTSKRSCIKFGALPTQLLPKKSHEATPPQARRTIIKQPIQVPALPPKLFQYNSIDDIMTDFQSRPLKNYRAYKVNSNRLHFTYYQDPDFHACPYISLYIKQEAKFTLSFALHGIYATVFSETLSLDAGLIDLLKNLSKVTACQGYPDVENGESMWVGRLVTVEVAGELRSECR